MRRTPPISVHSLLGAGLTTAKMTFYLQACWVQIKRLGNGRHGNKRYLPAWSLILGAHFR